MATAFFCPRLNNMDFTLLQMERFQSLFLELFFFVFASVNLSSSPLRLLLFANKKYP